MHLTSRGASTAGRRHRPQPQLQRQRRFFAVVVGHFAFFFSHGSSKRGSFLCFEFGSLALFLSVNLIER